MDERYRLTIDGGTDNAFTKEYTKEELESKKDYIDQTYGGRYKVETIGDADTSAIDDAASYTVSFDDSDFTKTYTGADFKAKKDYLDQNYGGRYHVTTTLGSYDNMRDVFGPSVKEQLDTFRMKNRDFMNDIEARREAAIEASKSQEAMRPDSMKTSSYTPISTEEWNTYSELAKQEEALKKAYFTSDEYLLSKSQKAYQLSQMQKQLQADIDLYASENPMIIGGAAFVPNPAVAGSRGLQEDEEMRNYDTARRILNETIKLQNAPSKYDASTGIRNMAVGAEDELTNAALWTAGLSEIADNLNVRGVLDKVQKELGNLSDLSEEKIESILTPAEKAVLQAWAINAQTQIERANDLSRGYQAGKGAVESLGFMAEFALTGGVGKATAEGAETFAKWLGKKLFSASDEVAGKVAREVAEEAGEGILKKYAKNLGLSLAEAAGRTGVMPSTFRNISEKALEIEEGEDGELRLIGMNRAFVKGLSDSFIENLSEGGRVNALGGLVGDTLNKIPKWNQFTDWLTHTKVGNLYTALQSSGIMNTLRAGGWHGIGEEYLEEWYGNAIRTITGVDKDALREFATKDNQLITIASFLPLTIFGGTVSTGQVLSAKKRLEASSAAWKSVLMERAYDEKQAKQSLDMLMMSSPAEIGKIIDSLVAKEAETNLGAAAKLSRAGADLAKSIIKWQAFNTKYKAQEAEQRKAVRDNLSESMQGKKWWMTDAKGKETVMRATNDNGDVIFVTYKPSNPGERAAGVTPDGNVVFFNTDEYQMEDEVSMDVFLGNEVMAEKADKEKARMLSEKDAAIAEIKKNYGPGAQVVIGTAEAPIPGTIVKRYVDGVAIETAQGVVMMTYEQLGNYVGVNATPLTDAQLDEQQSDVILAQEAQREAELDDEYIELTPIPFEEELHAEEDINAKKGRLQKLNDIAQSYAVQAEAAAVEQQIQASAANQMSDQQKEQIDAQYESIYGQTRSLNERVRLLQEYLNKMAEGSIPVVVLTEANYAQAMADAGCSKNLIKQIEVAIKNGAAIEGFMAAGKAFVFANNILSIDHGRKKYVHERQHVLTKSSDFVRRILATGVTREQLRDYLRVLSQGNFYDGYPIDVMADEFLSFAMELVYTYEDFSVSLHNIGVSDALINVIKSIDDEQSRTNGERLSQARRRRGLYPHVSATSTEYSGQDARNHEQVSRGVLEQQDAGSASVGQRGAGDREGGEGAEIDENGVTAQQNEEINKAVGGELEIGDESAPIRMSATAIAEGVGLELIKDDGEGNVAIVLPDGRIANANHLLTPEDIKDLPDSVLSYMMKDAKSLGMVGPAKEWMLWNKYTMMLNAILVKGSAENGGFEYLSSQWQWIAESIYKTVALNADSQYSYSLDITRVCKKNEAVITAIAEMQRRLGYGITPAQIMDIYLATEEAGYQVPCPVCYVFSRYIRNGKFATIMINGQRKYGDKLVDPRTLTEKEKQKRIQYWLAEKERLEAENEANKQAISKANEDIIVLMKKIDDLAQVLTDPRSTLTDEQKAEIRQQILDMDSRYKAALNVISQASLDSWITQFAIHEVTVDGKKRWELWDDTYMGFPEEMALDLRETATVMREFPAIQRFRNSRGSPAGKEITFASNNDLGDVPMALGSQSGTKDLAKPRDISDEEWEQMQEDEYAELKTGAQNLYKKAAKEKNPTKKRALLKAAKKRFTAASIYAKQQTLRGGQRMWSWSDNIERLAPDVFVNLLQMEMLGGALQAYSKQLEGIKLVAAMNGYINGSLMGKGNGYKEVSAEQVEEADGKLYLKDGDFIVAEPGKKPFILKTPVYLNSDGKYYVLEFDDVVGVDPYGKTAEDGHHLKGLFELNQEYDRAGNILVGMNDIHVRIAMADDRIFFIIPWHSSGANTHILAQMYEYLGVEYDVNLSQDYTDVQGEKRYKAEGEKEEDEDSADETTAEDAAEEVEEPGKKKKKKESAKITEHVVAFWNDHYENAREVPGYGKVAGKDFRCGIKGGIESSDGNGYISEGQAHYRELRDAIFVGVKVDTGRKTKKGKPIYKTLTVEEYSQEWFNEIMNDEFLSQVYAKVREAVGEKGFMTSKDCKAIYPYEYWDETSTYGTADINGVRYLEYCRRLGYKPKFCGKLDGKPESDYGNFTDDRGYWKVLIDRRMYGLSGAYQGLTPVTAENFTPDLVDPEKTKEEFVVTKVADEKGTQQIVDAALAREEGRLGGQSYVDYDLTLSEAAGIYEGKRQQKPKAAKAAKPKSQPKAKKTKAIAETKDIIEAAKASLEEGEEKIRYSVRESSMDEMDSLFREYNTDETLSALYDKVSGLAHTLDLKIKFDNPWSNAVGTTVADKVKFNAMFMDSPFQPAEKKAHAILHELIHATTQYAIQAKKAGILTEEMTEAVNQLESIYNEIKADPAFEGMRGVESVHEMVAELANPEFRAALKEKNLFQQIVDAIKRLLGIETGKNALDNLSSTLDYILENFDAGAYRKYVDVAQKNEGYTRFSVRSDEERAALFDAAKKEFGTTDNFKVAGYMLPDGSLLDFSEEGAPANQRTLDHREIEGIIMDEGKEYEHRWEYLADFMNEGAIRLLPEYAGINLMHAPTAEQRKRLFDFIYKYNGEVILEIADDRLNNVAYVEYDRRTSPARIFRDIDGYFNEGIIPQQDVRFSAITPHQSSLAEVSDMFNEWNKEEDLVPLMEKALKVAEEFGVQVRFASDEEMSGIFGQAWSTKVRFNADIFNWADEQDKARCILHELIHSASEYVMSADEADLLENQIEARREIEAIYEEVKSKFSKEYGTKSAVEMVAEMANPEFRAMLKEGTLWERFVNAIRRILGLEEKDYDRLTPTLDALERILETPDTWLKDVMTPTSEEYLRFSAVSITPEVREEMDRIAANAIIDGTYMLAPNGQPTKLTADQWALVRTQNFINWFGNWINDPENASKVVDKNGEPRVVYHGTTHMGYIFTSGFFGSDKQFADYYGFMGNPKSHKTVEAFLNIRNPKIVDAEYAEYDAIDMGRYITTADYLVDETREEGKYDGLIIKNVDERGGGVEFMDDYIPFDPNQIKSATETTGEFSESGDIRFSAMTDSNEASGTRFSVRTNPAPVKTQPVYKLMRLGKDGKLYPLFIGSAEAIELGIWYDADSPNLGDLTKLATGVHLVNNETGEAMTLEEFKAQHPEIGITGKRPNVEAINWATANGMRWIEIEDKEKGQKRYGGEARSYFNLGINGSGQVGQFAMRPGWHAGSLPTMRQIGKGSDKYLRDDSFVWVKGRVPADIDYQAEADANPDKDIPTHIPTDGYYMKATNANAAASQADRVGWYVAGSFIADEIISDEEARRVITEWNEEHPDAQVKYDFRRESGMDYVPGVGMVETTLAPAKKAEDVVAEGLSLTDQEFARLAGDIFAALPKKWRKEVTDNLTDILGLQKDMMQIVTRLAEKENWSEREKELAKDIRNILMDILDPSGIDIDRPLTTKEALWMLYNALEKETDMISEAKRSVVAHNLGFDIDTLAKEAEAKEEVRFSARRNAKAEATARLYNKAATNVWARLKETFVDMFASVEDLVKAIEKVSGKVAEGFENIILALNQQSSRGFAAMEKYEQEYLDPMFDEIDAIMNSTGMTYDEVVRYVILKHGLERNEEFAKRDAREFYEDEFRQKVASIRANESLTEQQKKAQEAQAERELDQHLTDINWGIDVKYKELREKDYSGITSMFYDQLGVKREDFDTEEAYQSAIVRARRHKYDTLADVEAAAANEVRRFEGMVNTDNLWKAINASTKEILRQQYEASMISKESYEKLKDMFKFYVPLRGFKDNTAEDMYTYYQSPNSTGYTKPILAAEGRSTEAESPFGWIASMASSAIASNVKNEARLALYYFVVNRPDNGLATVSKTWYVHEPGDVTPDGKKIFRPSYPPLTPDMTAQEAKDATARWMQEMEAARAQGNAYESGKKLNLGDSVVNISDASIPEHAVKVKVGGKDYVIFINGNPRAAQAINGNLNIETDEDYSKVFGKVLRWMSSVNTSYNPEFWVTNMQRDMLFTLMAINTKEDPEYRRKFASNYAKAFKVIKMAAQNEEGTLGDAYLEEMYRQFVENGGVTGYTQIKDNEIWEQEIADYMKSKDKERQKMGMAMKKAKDGLHKIHRFGESLEQVSRFAAFLTSREMGRSMAESISDAKEITVNFNRKGSGRWISPSEARTLTDKNGQLLNRFEQFLVSAISSISPIGRRSIMFFNAAIQGLNATYKLYKANPAKMIGIWSLGYMSVGVMNALLHNLMDDDDDYLDMPQYERRGSLMLGADGFYFKWAIPQEAKMFYALGDIIVEQALGRNPQKWYDEGSALREAARAVTEVLPVNPLEGWRGILPSVLVPVAELIVNEDYKGQPIYRESKWMDEEETKRTARWSRAYEGTGLAYVGISQLLNNLTGGDARDAGIINIPPEAMEHIVQSSFGGTIRTMDKFVTTVIAALDQEVSEKDEPLTMRQTPFLNRLFVLNDERFKNVHVNQVYDFYKAEAEHAKKLEKGYKEDRNIDKLLDLRISKEYRWARIYERYEKPIEKKQEQVYEARTSRDRKRLQNELDALKKRMIRDMSQQ